VGARVNRELWPNWQVDISEELEDLEASETNHDTFLAESLFIMRHIDAANDPHIRVRWESELAQFEVDMAELCAEWPAPEFEEYLDDIAASTAALLVQAHATGDIDLGDIEADADRHARQIRVAAFLNNLKRASPGNEPAKPEQEPATVDSRMLAVFASRQFAALSPRAVKLLVHAGLEAIRCGKPFSMTLRQLKPLGFNSDWRSAAIDEAMGTGFLDCVEPADRGARKPALYWPTWLPRIGETEPRDTWSTITPKTYTRKPRPDRKRSENYPLERIERRKERSRQFLKKVGT
jgi:hypothetical protein